jgi:hypothetical protein
VSGLGASWRTSKLHVYMSDGGARVQDRESRRAMFVCRYESPTEGYYGPDMGVRVVGVGGSSTRRERREKECRLTRVLPGLTRTDSPD